MSVGFVWRSVWTWLLPLFSLIRDLRKQHTRGNVSKISVNHTCHRQIGSKSTDHSPLVALKVTLVAVIGGFRSDLSITLKTDGNFGNVSAGVLGVFHSTKISGNPGSNSNETDISRKFVSKISVHLSRLSFFLEISCSIWHFYPV